MVDLAQNTNKQILHLSVVDGMCVCGLWCSVCGVRVLCVCGVCGGGGVCVCDVCVCVCGGRHQKVVRTVI